eukprot:358752-Chlamydomonas_euryale.AAC.10
MMTQQDQRLEFNTFTLYSHSIPQDFTSPPCRHASGRASHTCSSVISSAGRDSAGVPVSKTARLAFCSSASAAFVRWLCARRHHQHHTVVLWVFCVST